MVVIPAGRSVMGSLRGEAGRLDNEGPPDGPRREVTLRAPLSVGKHEVTRGQFAAFQRATGRNMGEDCLSQSWRRAISWSSPGFEQTDEHPVVCVSWEDAQAYVRWLSERTGQKYRLLTEAEWEYSARAGTQTRYWFGDTIDQRQASFHGDNGNLGRTQPAGIYPQNGFGLHDMHGNVSEWVEDCYVDRYPTGSGEASQAMNQTNCASRVIRGGAWGNAAFRLRSAYRGFDYPTSRADTFGFRVARMPATSGSAASTSAPRVPAARNPASAESSSPGITDCDRLAQPLRSELGRSALVPGVAPTEIDLPRARAACEAAIAAHPQEPRFQAWLGRILEDQDTDYRFISQAVAPTRRAAEMGHAFAQNRYGLMLMRGEYVQRDYAQAAQWFRRAAEQGYAKAQNNYGEILDLEGSRGRIEDFGVRQNVREAALWFRRAAEQGDADGQNNFGVRLASGKGVTQDLSGAVRWFRRAADQGHILAQFTLGHFLQNGLGTEPNLEEAVMWYQRAARQGLPIAEDRLRRLNRSW
jgi:formylglycine-generating enzyme required for sulfatase activity/TPR repeat protein